MGIVCYDVLVVREECLLAVGRVPGERLVGCAGSEFVDVGDPFEVVTERGEPVATLAVDVLVEYQPVAHRSVLGRGQGVCLLARLLLPALDLAHLPRVVVVARERR